jgi:acetolactate synthase regulatory subunit
MSHQLVLKVRKVEGALLRLLGQIGRRGYDVLGVSAKLTPDKRHWDVVVDFEPFMPVPPAPPLPRPAEVLPRLVSKLEEVVSVELRSAPPKPGATTPGNGGSHEAPKPAARPSGEMKWEE